MSRSHTARQNSGPGSRRFRNGRPFPLTPLEFRLLSVFIQHRGRALSRQRLIDEAWGHATFVTNRVVDNQVTKLRKKLEARA